MSEMHRPTVLVVEDDFDISEALAEILSEAGYTVDCARDGSEALKHLADQPPPQLILLDLMMPIMDGFQFRAEQMRHPELAQIPVVVLSADREVVQRGRQFGGSECVRKPVRLDELLTTVRRYC